MIKNSKLKLVLFGFILTLLFSICSIDVFAWDNNDDPGDPGVAVTEDIEIWRYKWSLNNSYKDNGHEGIDYVVSNRGIRYPAWKIGGSIPGFIFDADMSSRKESIAQFGYVKDGTGTVKNGANVTSVMLYLHRVTNNMELYKPTRLDWYYDSDDCMERDTIGCEQLKATKSIVNNIGGYKAPSSQFVYTPVPHVLGYEGKESNFTTGVMDNVNEAIVPVLLDKGNTGLFSVNMDKQADEQAVATYLKSNFPLTNAVTSSSMQNGSNGYTPFSFLSPDGTTTSIDIRGNSSNGLEKAIKDMKGPQFVGSIEIAMSEAITVRNSTYAFMSSMNNNGNYYRSTLIGNRGSKSGISTYGVLAWDPKGTDLYAFGSVAGVDTAGAQNNITALTIRSAPTGQKYNSQSIKAQNGNFKNISVPIIRIGYNKEVQKQFNYLNETSPYSFTIDGKTYSGYKIVPKSNAGANKGLSTMWYNGYPDIDEFGVWRQTGYSVMNKMVGTYLPRDVKPYTTVYGQKESGYSGTSNDDPYLQRFPWKIDGSRRFASSPSVSKNFLNGYLMKKTNGEMDKSYIKDYNNALIAFVNSMKTMPDLLLRTFVLERDSQSGRQDKNDCGNETGPQNSWKNIDESYYVDIKATTKYACVNYPSLKEANNGEQRIDEIASKLCTEINAVTGIDSAICDYDIDVLFEGNTYFNKSTSKYPNSWAAIQAALGQKADGSNTTYWEDLAYVYLQYFAIVQLPDNYSMGMSFVTRNAGGQYYNYENILDTDQSNIFILNEEKRLGDAIVGNVNEAGNPIGTPTKNALGEDYGSKFGAEIFAVDQKDGEIFVPEKEQKCPTGYTKSGSDCVRIEKTAINTSCRSGLIYDSKTKKCIEHLTATAECPEGFTIKGSRCIKETEGTCSSGTALLPDGTCGRITLPQCPPLDPEFALENPDIKSNQYEGKQKCTDGQLAKCATGKYSESYEMCVLSGTMICEEGIWNSIASKCITSEPISCPSGFKFNAGICKKENPIIEDIKLCPTGYTAATNYCYKETRVPLEDIVNDAPITGGKKELSVVEMDKLYVLRNYVAYQPSDERGFTFYTGDKDSVGIVRSGAFPNINSKFYLYKSKLEPTGICRDSLDTDCVPAIPAKEKGTSAILKGAKTGNLSGNKLIASAPIGDSAGENIQDYLWAEYTPGNTSNFSPLYSKVDLLFKFKKDSFCYYNKRGSSENLQISDEEMTCVLYENPGKKSDLLVLKNGQQTLNIAKNPDGSFLINSLIVQTSITAPENIGIYDKDKAFEIADNNFIHDDTSAIVTGFTPLPTGDVYIDRIELYDDENSMVFAVDAMTKDRCTNGFPINEGLNTPFTTSFATETYTDGKYAQRACEQYSTKTIHNLDISKNYYFKVFTKYVQASLTGIASIEPANITYQAVDLKHSGNYGAIAIFDTITTAGSSNANDTYTIRTTDFLRGANVPITHGKIAKFDMLNFGLMQNATSKTLLKTDINKIKNHINPTATVLDPMAALTLPAKALTRFSVTSGQLDFSVSNEMMIDNAYPTWDFFPFNYEIGANLDNGIKLIMKCTRGGAYEEITTRAGTCVYVDNTYTNCKIYAVIERVSGNGDTTTNIKVATSTDRDIDPDVENKGSNYTGPAKVRLSSTNPKMEIYIKDINPATTKEVYGEGLYRPSENSNYPDKNAMNDKTEDCWMFSPVDYSVENLQLQPQSVTPNIDYVNGTIQRNNKPVDITGSYSITKIYDKGSTKNVDIKYVLSDGLGSTFSCTGGTPASALANISEGKSLDINFAVTCNFDFARITPGNNVKLEIWINGGKTDFHKFGETNYDNNVTFRDIFTTKPCVGDNCYECDENACLPSFTWDVNFDHTMYEFQRNIVEKQTNTQANLKWTDWRVGTIASVPSGPYKRDGDALDKTYDKPITSGNRYRAPNDYMAFRSEVASTTKLCTDYKAGFEQCWRYENNVSHNISYYKMSTANTKVYTTRPVLRSPGGRCSATQQTFNGETWGNSQSGKSGSRHSLANSSFTPGGTLSNSTCHGFSGSTGTSACTPIRDWWGVTICRDSPEIYDTAPYSSAKPSDYIPAKNFDDYDVLDGRATSVTTNTDRVTLPEQSTHGGQGGNHTGWVSTTKYTDTCTNEQYLNVYYFCPSGFTFTGPSGMASATTAPDAKCNASGSAIRQCNWTDRNNAPQSEWWPTTPKTCYRQHYDVVCPSTYAGGDIQDCDHDGTRCQNVSSSSYRCRYEKVVRTNYRCSPHTHCAETKESCSGEGEKRKCRDVCVRRERCISYNEYSTESGWTLMSPDRDSCAGNISCPSSSYGTAERRISNQGLRCDSHDETARGKCWEPAEESLSTTDLRCTNWQTVSYQEVKYYSTTSPSTNLISRTYANPTKVWEYTCNTSTPTTAYPAKRITSTRYTEKIILNGEIKTERSKTWIPINNTANIKDANPRGGEWFELRFTTIYETTRGRRPNPDALLSDYYNNYHNIGLPADDGYSTYPVKERYNHYGRLDTPLGSTVKPETGRDVVNNKDYGYCDARPSEPYGSKYNGWQFAPITRNDSSEDQGHPGMDWTTSKNNGNGVTYFGPDNNTVWKKKVFGDDVLTAIEICPGNVIDCTEKTSIISGNMEVESSRCTRWEYGLCTQYTKVFRPQKTRDSTGKYHQGYFVPVDFKAQTVTIQASTSKFTAVGEFEKILLGGLTGPSSGTKFYNQLHGAKWDNSPMQLCKCNTYPIILKDGEVSWATSEWEVE